MGLFNKNNGGLMDEIRCDEQDYLIWKWRPQGSMGGPNTRENSIRFGSSLRVRDGAVAVFVYKKDGETFQEFIEGPFDQILSTKNLPIIASIVGLAYDGGTPFQAEVYFINLAKIVQIKFGVPFFDVFDPRFLDFSVPVAVRGMLTFKIQDYKEFVTLHRLDEFNLSDFEEQVKSAIERYIKSIVANEPMRSNLPLIQIERRIGEVNVAALPEIAQRFTQDFGVNVSGVDISTIEIDKTSEGYRQLMAVTKDIMSETTQAQAQVNIQNLVDQQRINAENMEETLRIQREESQYAQHKQTQTTFMPAYQIEQQAAVGIAGAEALGNMGSSAAVNMGDAGGGDGNGMGFNPAAMMAGMAMGGAVGQNMAGIMNNMMGGLASSVPNQVPPPIQSVQWYVANNGQPSGPFDINLLVQMKSTGLLTPDSLMWKEGMPQWAQASSISELQSLFAPAQEMPPIPQE